MPVRVERRDRVLTVIDSRAEARNVVDPEHAQALYEAFVAFDKDEAADVAVFNYSYLSVMRIENEAERGTWRTDNHHYDDARITR
jgi:hypothetical protein